MKFELWSIWHILYMFSPFILFSAIYFSVKNSSNKVKNICGYVLGGISVLILIIRNVDIFLRSGWDLEVIPLQVCHIGSLIAGFALIFKKQNWLALTALCFNILPAFLAMVFADSLANYDTLLKIRPQTYIWGHIFIIVCALYALFVYRPTFTTKDLYRALSFVAIMAITAIICNSLFRELFTWAPNYFYLFNHKGTPLKFLYTALPSSKYGWFEINWLYTGTLLAVFTGVFIGSYHLSKWISNTLSKQKPTKMQEISKK